MSLSPFLYYLVFWFVCASSSSADAAEGGAVTRISVQKCAEYTTNWCPETEDLYKKHPYVVAVKVGVEKPRWVCAGTLISERHVLTIGHCTKNSGGRKIVRVKMGNPSVAGSLQERDVQRVIVHPDTRHASTYAIAIIEFVSPVTITDYVRPACLYQNQNLTATTGTEAAWIIRPENHGIMKESRIVIQQKKACSDIYNTYPQIKQELRNATICASYEDENSECLANSGVPLLVSAGQCKVQAAGLLSYGTICGRPVVYTSIASYLDWIESVVWPHPS